MMLARQNKNVTKIALNQTTLKPIPTTISNNFMEKGQSKSNTRLQHPTRKAQQSNSMYQQSMIPGLARVDDASPDPRQK